MKARRLRLGLLFVVMCACGGGLISDPSFDLWCGSKLCAPWQVDGSVKRVRTWHEHDYGVSLEDGSVISQRAKDGRVDCIEFEVIADVSAESAVWLEMDFGDDGSSEYRQLLPESRWNKLRYLVKTPSWYDQVRFILRKTGSGHAVLAQIEATAALSSDCKSEEVPLTDRPLGAKCENDAQCASGLCTESVSAVGQDGIPSSFAGDVRGNGSCGECSMEVACADGLACGVASSASGLHTQCATPNSGLPGALCLTAEACESQRCSRATMFSFPTCATCETDAQCESDEVCGVTSDGGGPPAAACQPRAVDALGERCSQDAECASGVCCGSVCSECCDDHPCPDGGACTQGKRDWFVGGASLCGARSGDRARDGACTDDADCESGACLIPEPVCDACPPEGCNETGVERCFLLQWLPLGACR